MTRNRAHLNHNARYCRSRVCSSKTQGLQISSLGTPQKESIQQVVSPAWLQCPLLLPQLGGRGGHRSVAAEEDKTSVRGKSSQMYDHHAGATSVGRGALALFLSHGEDQHFYAREKCPCPASATLPGGQHHHRLTSANKSNVFS